MGILRTRHDRSNPYVVINKQFLEDPRLSAKAKGILAYLLSRPDNWETNTVHLTKVMADGRDAIASGLRELEKHGYFKRKAIRDEKTGRISHWIRDVYEVPHLDEENGKSAKNPTNTPNSCGLSAQAQSTSDLIVDSDTSQNIENGKSAKTPTNTPNSCGLSAQATNGFSVYGFPVDGFPVDGFPVDGKPGPIIYKDVVTIEKIINDEISNECNNAHADEREDTHTQRKASSSQNSFGQQEIGEQVIDGELQDLWGQEQDRTNSHWSENSIDNLDQYSAAPRDNSAEKPIKYNGLTLQQVEELQEKFDSGEITELPRREKIALALYLIPEVNSYRKSGKILQSKPNDLDPAFLGYFAYTQWNGSTDCDKARNTLIKYESSLTHWTVLCSVIQRWVEFKKNPEAGYSAMRKEAMGRMKDKRSQSTDADRQILSKSIRVTNANPGQKRKEADQARKRYLDQLQAMEG